MIDRNWGIIIDNTIILKKDFKDIKEFIEGEGKDIPIKLKLDKDFSGQILLNCDNGVVKENLELVKKSRPKFKR